MTTNLPKTLGRYEIVEELGRGAMGVVYLAWDPLIGRQVALKVLRFAASASDEELAQIRRRFIREAQSAGILSHKNIVTIHDVVELSEDQATFIAMEHVRGTDMKQLLKGEHPLDPDFVSDVVCQVADALDYAHSQGVVHRDIKPANILITANRQVKITDFGIARLQASNLTQDTQLLGTPNYMAPEQIRGGELDHRVDIFALGVLLYEMVTGQKPFRGENLTEVTHRIVYEEATPPRQHVGDLPLGVERVIRHALEKEPDDRYPSARQLAVELSEAVAAYRSEASLNETQEVVLTPPPPLPVVSPPSPPSPGGADRLLGIGRHLAAAGEALRRAWDGLRPAPGAAPARARPSGWRLTLVAAAALVTSAAVGGLLLLWAAPSPPPVEQSDAARQLNLRLLPLMQEGRRLLLEGNPAAAAVKLRMAERLAPERIELRSWRELAERQAEALERLTERERRLARHLAEAEAALASRRYREAIDSAQAFLDLSPDEGERAAEARRILTAGQGALTRLERRRQESARVVESGRVAAAPGTRGPQTEPALASRSESAGEPSLEVEFITEEPAGNLTVFLGQDRLLNETFRFYEKKGFLGLGGAKPYDGRIYLPPTEVPRGPATLRIYVTLRGQAAQAKILQGEFAAGEKRRLHIHFSAEGELAATLE